MIARIILIMIIQSTALQASFCQDTTENRFTANQEREFTALSKRNVPDSIVNALKQQDDFWYANKDLVKKTGNRNMFVNQPWFKTLLWVVIIGVFAGFLVWYLANNQVGIFSRKRQVITEEPEIELTAENLFLINYQREIDKAVREQNFRLAIRLMFLRLLKQLSDKNIIQFKQDRTNLDYLQQLHASKYYRDFFQVTRNYEYSWYGQFPVNEEAYHQIRKEFEKFDRTIN